MTKPKVSIHRLLFLPQESSKVVTEGWNQSEQAFWHTLKCVRCRRFLGSSRSSRESRSVTKAVWGEFNLLTVDSTFWPSWATLEEDELSWVTFAWTWQPIYVNRLLCLYLMQDKGSCTIFELQQPGNCMVILNHSISRWFLHLKKSYILRRMGVPLRMTGSPACL